MVIGILQEINTEAINEIKDHLFDLYKQELYARQLYHGQIRKLEGGIIPILKELSIQEELHVETIKILLLKINFEVKDNYEIIPASKINEPLINAIQIDIEEEELATKKYKDAINASTSEEMKKLLEYILKQEFDHVNVLKRYFAENKDLFS